MTEPRGGAVFVLCAACAGWLMGCTTLASHAISGVVAGGGYYQSAKVCVDTNDNGRCDPGEPSTTTDSKGRFTVSARGPLAAQITPGVTTIVDPATSQTTPVSRALTFRAPAEAPRVLSAISTELQALMDAGADKRGYANALSQLARRVGVPATQLLEDYTNEVDSAIATALANETALASIRIEDAVADAQTTGNLAAALRNRLALDTIETLVVIYAENRSFDNLFGLYPGADGVHSEQAQAIKQVDRDGTTVLPTLPPAWRGLTAPGQTPAVTKTQTQGVWPNAPFQIDDPRAPSLYHYSALTDRVITEDLYHRFFEHMMQIDGGRNDQFAAWGDSGGLVMGYYDGSRMQMWTLAQQFTLADHFFQGAYGGSFLNHQYLICACAPKVSAEFVSTAKPVLNVLGEPNMHGVPQLAHGASMTASALDSAPVLKTGNIAPVDYFGPGDGYRAVNTMQPPYQPSGNAPADAQARHTPYANPALANTLEPQSQPTIGDRLDAKAVPWAWYAGGWAAATADPWEGAGKTAKSTTVYYGNAYGTADAAHTSFQAHHQPFNYYRNFDPVERAQARNQHLKDRADLLADITAGKLPAVTFYKPVGYQNQHPGYANVAEGDAEITETVNRLRQSPQWRHMLIIVTYDEFGGQFDHVPPPKGDLLGPGTRIPAIIISPYARKGWVDHTPYDTGSIARFITHRFSLTPLEGVTVRDRALVANGGQRMGYFTSALDLR